jgi:hypothetical protein
MIFCFSPTALARNRNKERRNGALCLFPTQFPLMYWRSYCSVIKVFLVFNLPSNDSV